MNKLTVFNAESAYFYFMDKEFRRSILGSRPMYCDSASLSFVLSLRSIPHSRLHGPDFMERYLRGDRSEPLMVIGGTSQAHEHMRMRYQLDHVKFVDRYVSVDDLNDLLNELEMFGPKMVFVCLGLRKQEAVVNAIWQHFNARGGLENTSVIGVGAAVDFLGGTKVRSGRVWQALGLEWLPRLVREPRMAPRVIRSFAGCALAFTQKQKFDIDSLTFAEQFDAY